MKKDQLFIAKSNGKLPFKFIKGDKIKYSLADSYEHAYSKFKKWRVIATSWDEFELNYKFKKINIMDKKEILKQLSNVHQNVQEITIGVANIYGGHELVIDETEYSFRTISFGKLGGVVDSTYPKSDFDFKRIPYAFKTMANLMCNPIDFKDFVDKI